MIQLDKGDCKSETDSKFGSDSLFEILIKSVSPISAASYGWVLLHRSLSQNQTLCSESA